MASSCLGISFLGICEYNPAQPQIAYFTIGEAAAALSVALLIPPFLKRIYRFRLRVRYTPLWSIYVLLFVTFACVVFAALICGVPRTDRM